MHIPSTVALLFIVAHAALAAKGKGRLDFRTFPKPMKAVGASPCIARASTTTKDGVSLFQWEPSTDGLLLCAKVLTATGLQRLQGHEKVYRIPGTETDPIDDANVCAHLHNGMITAGEEAEKAEKAAIKEGKEAEKAARKARKEAGKAASKEDKEAEKRTRKARKGKYDQLRLIRTARRIALAEASWQLRISCRFLEAGAEFPKTQIRELKDGAKPTKTLIQKLKGGVKLPKKLIQKVKDFKRKKRAIKMLKLNVIQNSLTRLIPGSFDSLTEKIEEEYLGMDKQTTSLLYDLHVIAVIRAATSALQVSHLVPADAALGPADEEIKTWSVKPEIITSSRAYGTLYQVFKTISALTDATKPDIFASPDNSKSFAVAEPLESFDEYRNRASEGHLFRSLFVVDRMGHAALKHDVKGTVTKGIILNLGNSWKINGRRAGRGHGEGYAMDMPPHHDDVVPAYREALGERPKDQQKEPKNA